MAVVGHKLDSEYEDACCVLLDLGSLGEPEAEDVEERDAESHRPVDPSRFPKRGPSRPPGTSWCHDA